MIGLRWDPERGRFDLATDESGLLEDVDGYETAVVISLFTDARAPASAGLAAELRRGWLGEAFDAGEVWGSRIWLVLGRPLTKETGPTLRAYTRQALEWMVRARVVDEVVVDTKVLSRDGLRWSVGLSKGGKGVWSGAWRVGEGVIEWG